MKVTALNISSARACVTCILVSSLMLTSTALSAAAQRFTVKDFSHWLDSAYIADATYKDSSAIKDALSLQGYKLDRFKQLEGFSVAYVIATDDSTKQHI
ncbi:MAG: hypothetical protein KAT12_01890, partial [Gammaproteobacteria bacterium]|nr:hypothetical protein [Gammaproteobacteria bacterium]